MRKYLVIGLWVVAIGLWANNYTLLVPETTIPEPYQSLYEEVLSPVVMVKTTSGTGSGVIISPTDQQTSSNEIYILTAAHVVGDFSEVTIRIYEYHPELINIETATVVITDTAKDLALLRFESGVRRYASAKLAPRDYKPYLFTPVYAVGGSLGLDPRPSEGIITAVSRQKTVDSSQRWEISAHIYPGNSGGGVFTRDTHCLIGISIQIRVMGWQRIPGMAIIVPINQIYEFLQEAEVFETRAQLVGPRTTWSTGHAPNHVGFRAFESLSYLAQGDSFERR